ncbi:MAG TPA: peptidoglycan-binding protein [Thermoanaerobaculia bacterium]|nr:peptidoglycan-binding protein [Thermoanaerobaculia bacterium]
MPEQQKIAKAELQELDTAFANQINPLKATKVQFNPDSLKVAFANQIQQPQGGGDQSGAQAQQFVGAGSTKLTATLWFDVTHELGELPETMDVRTLTQRVAYFITPKGEPENQPTKWIPPAVRFLWGTFQFDGIMESMEESLELFSAEGRPLRASVAITLTQQKITTFAFNDKNVAQPPGFKRAAGTTPQTQATENSNLQSMAAAQPGGGNSGSSSSSGGSGGGGGRDWQSVASANGIENPRLLEPGQFIDFQATTPRILTE